MRAVSLAIILFILAAGGVPACAGPATQPSQPGLWLLHFPGIDGYRRFDNRMIAGLIQGGVSAQFEVYDWTAGDPGIDSLHAQVRNRREAANVAGLIADHSRQFPGIPIDLTAHSGGCGVAIWTLEQLPADVSVNTVVLLAPAVSPGYDLSKALRHVRGNLFVFSSTRDELVLSTGTRLFGTMDGILTESAGFGGFVTPPGADATQYQKLISCPYQAAWEKYGDNGGHLGPLSRRFAAVILAPLLEDPSTTQPSDANVQR